MGHWSEETAYIRLPKSAVPAVRRALRESHNLVREAALARAKEIHRGVRTTSKRSFDADMTDRYSDGSKRFPWSSGAIVTPAHLRHHGPASVDDAAQGLAHHILRQAYLRAKTSVPVPTQADVEAVFPKATTRTTEFPILGDHCADAEVTIGEDGILHWERLSERAHSVMETGMARVLWRALDEVKWTRGTGGEVLHQSEHSVEAFAGPSVVRTYGKQAA